MAQRGDETLKERQALIEEQRRFVQDQIDQLMFYMQELDFKEWYYKKLWRSARRASWTSTTTSGRPAKSA